MRRAVLVIGVTALIVAGCAADADSGADSTTPSTTTTSAPTSITSTTEGTTTSAVDPVGETAEYRWVAEQIDGVETITLTTLESIPEAATVVEFATTVIDDGDGFKVCLIGVAQSLPPQCGGPIAEGLEAGPWAETASGVTWGGRVVRVSWPPVDGRVTLIDEASQRSGDPINAYPEGRVFDPGTEYTIEELQLLQEQITEAMHDLGFESFGAGLSVGQQIHITLPVVDRATIRSLAAVADDPSILQVSGAGAIIDG